MFPLTKITNKHLLPVYDLPMIYYPIQTLVNAGVDDIMIVTGGRNSGDFLRLLGNGSEFGLKHLNYAYQEGEGGIAAALELAEHQPEGFLPVMLVQPEDRAAPASSRGHASDCPHPAVRQTARPTKSQLKCQQSRIRRPTLRTPQKSLRVGAGAE